MKILVVGSGGREHALAWKISQSPRIEKIFCAPGNGGTMSIAENVPISETDIAQLKSFAGKEKIDLTIVGPELPLTLGIVDEFEQAGLRCFGPYKIAAELEASKVFAKQFMDRHKIPTARFKVAETPEEAKKIINAGEFSFPVIVKADGLAAGKGVLICRNSNKAEAAIESIMVEKKFGDAGKLVVIEEFLWGHEMSFIVLSDGVKVAPLVSTMDYKAAYDGGRGPNTGGMGAISPNPHVDREMFNEIVKTIIFPTVTRMHEEGRKYRGVMYAGLMLTAEGPKVLEFNCRFGDPETQVQMLRLESDLLDILEAAMEEDVLLKEIAWNRKASGCVIVASGGYPSKYAKGKSIEGLEHVTGVKDIVVFHAGTTLSDDRYYTNGGRVLGVCSAQKTLTDAMQTIYKAIPKLYFEAMQYRRDIGAVLEETEE